MSNSEMSSQEAKELILNTDWSKVSPEQGANLLMAQQTNTQTREMYLDLPRLDQDEIKPE